MSTTDAGAQRIDRVAGPPSRYRALVRRLHFYAGLFVAPFLLVAAISGALYALSPTVEQWAYRDYLHVESRGATRPVAEQIRAAEQVRPDLTVTAVRPAGAPGETTRVLFDDPTLGSSERRAVFVDPVSAEPVGELTVYGSSGALPMRTWIDNLHRSLHLGEAGRLYSELAASWLWILALGGCYLWISGYRARKRSRTGRARLFTVDRTTRGRARTLNWHGAVGIWIAAGLVFLSATGLTWSAYAGENVTKLRAALSWTTPAVSTTLGPHRATPTPPAASGHTEHSAPHGSEAHASPAPAASAVAPVDQVDTVLASARAVGIGGKVEVGIPSTSDTAFTVAQTRQPWVMSNNAVAVDGATGAVTDVSWFADWPVAAKLSAWGIQLHMGTLFGLLNQVVLVGLVGALVTVMVRGYLMWWRRRPAAQGGRFGRPPPRGTLAALPPGPAVAVVVLAAAVGWFIPLLGVSLAAFVAVDVVVGLAQRRRTRTGASAAERPPGDPG